MATITVSNLSFHYDESYDNIFENVSFSIDTSWKLGFIGRNGRGKTTFLNLLMGKYEYSGNISANVHFDYFPFEINDKSKTTYEIAYEINSAFEEYEKWKLDREVSLLEMEPEDILNRPFETLSKGEQTKVLLAILFIRDNNFLLIDEPTNHLDAQSRVIVAKYLNGKRSFILVSHDRTFLNNCVNHILSINKTNIEIQQGNFSSWLENKERQDIFELAENEKLKRDISRLEQSAKQATDWSYKIEASKSRNTAQSDNRVDKGFIGAKAAKMAQRAKNTENRRDKAVEDKSKLLKNIETAESLKLNPLTYKNNRLIDISNLSIFYGENKVCEDVDFVVENGDRIHLKGPNGCGKSSIIKLILGQNISYVGNVFVANEMKISYVSQDTSFLMGNLTDFARESNIDESLFKSILRKFDFARIQFDKNMENYSEGQKKKVLIAKSLCEQADLYIWDEPLNYIDFLSRIQIEDVILNYRPTMIFVEHDELFSEKIATDVVLLEKNLKKNKSF
ncbi:MAG: ABC-F type ribosomal protection protein [Bacilli bacterium]|nr:ABC-F type ribosomal protection protein [Bacilli bacterium]